MMELAQLVRQMRHTQKRYERTGKAEILPRKHNEEKTVDDAIARILDTQTTMIFTENKKKMR